MKRRELLLYGLGLAALRAEALGDMLRVASIQHDVEAWIALQVLAAIYQRAGLRMEPVMVPPVRASVSIATGDADAELMRPLSYASDHPELLRVPTPFYRVYVHAYWLPGQDITINSTADLHRYSVGIVRGLASARDVAASAPGFTPIYAVNHEQLCRMLRAGHVQVAMDTRLRMQHMLHEQGLDAAHSSPELARFDLYHWLGKRFAADVPRIDAAIRAFGPAELERMALQGLETAKKMKPGEF